MFRAKKSLGQNFLVNRGILDKVISAAEITEKDTILEIGSGTGILTEKLAQEAGRVIAVEKDHRLVELLKKKFSTKSTNSAIAECVDIVEEDILKFQSQDYGLKDSKYKIVGNIPYYITSHLFKTIFEEWPMPKLIVLMVQKEVAQRIMAKPPHMNLLALSVQFYSEPKIISYVSKGSFRPIPKVDSAIIRLVSKNEKWIMDYEIRGKFFKLIKTAFAGKRKQLKNTIGLEILKKAKIKPESRPEELSLENWIRIASEV